ncbi:MAG: ribonuclease III [Lachnospiraceae bacterium]
MRLADFEAKIDYKFQEIQLLEQAMTHSSYANEKQAGKRDNERLEFLGDAVLELVSSEFLFSEYPSMKEGDLTKLRASLVCEPTLADCAEQLSIGTYVHLGKGEDQTGGRKRKSILSDALEALIGAIYLDGGLANAKEFILQFILTDIENKKLFYDSKTILQEYVQGNYSEELVYALIGEEGPDHDKRFHAEARIGSRAIGTGIGHTKKAAEQQAAYEALLNLKNDGKENLGNHVLKKH